tara:strand:+ start:194 stop:319 length:126 start_codon:yes stop_codon:yes gene_type:complete
MDTIKILAFGCFFGVVGFGLGRLRLHAANKRMGANQKHASE